MRHTCEHCETRYEIPDAKVVGRRVKVRCQRCDGIMFVVGPGAQLQDPSRVPAAGIYYYAAEGQAVGPMGSYSLLEKVREGRIGARTYVWSPSLDGWQRVIESPQLGWLFEAVMAAQLQRQVGSDAFDRAALMSDGRGYFPDPTLKSGVILLDQTAQHHLETLARQAGLVPLPPRPTRSWAAPLAAAAATLALGVVTGAAVYLAGWGHDLPALSSLLGEAYRTVASL